MNLPTISSYEIKLSRTGHKIPVVNGVLLHSLYNPIKEAEILISNYSEQLKNKREVLVMGLGFGYHLSQLKEFMSKTHGRKFKIIVIEPSTETLNNPENENFSDENTLIYSGMTALELYSDIDFIHFLLKKPVIIAHPASFNLYAEYFKSILKFRSPERIVDCLPLLKNKEVIDYFSTFDSGLTLNEIISTELENKNNLQGLDFLSLALGEMTRKSQIINSEKNGAHDE